MNKKIIGIPVWNQGETSVGCTKPYLEYLKKYGDIVMLSPTTVIDVDLLVLPGGKDLINGNDTEFSFFNSDGERFLEIFDRLSLPKYIENRVPVLGICRGYQSLMRFFGANLIQHIYWDHGYSKDNDDIKAHGIIFDNEVKRKYVPSLERVPNNIGSWHHQGVFVKDVPESFDILAYSTDFDKESIKMKSHCIAEYVIHKELPVVGIQSHPERNYFSVDDHLIKYLLRSKA